MGTENYANGKILYTSDEDENRMCVENLKDDAHYRFQCRCGCGATFAGYGKDIRAAARVGGDITAFPADPQIGDQWFDQRTNTIYVCTDRKADRPTWSKVEPAITTTTNAPAKLNTMWNLESAVDLRSMYDDPVVPVYDNAGELSVDDDLDDDLDIDLDDEPEEGTPDVYVSDRFLKKAQFDLTDEEVDAYAEDNKDPLELKGVDLSKRQPPAIAAQVYSLATGDGPMTLLEYQDKEIKVDGETKRILSGLCRTQEGSYVMVPLADLAVEFEGRARPEVKQRSTLVTLAMMIASGVVGSGLGMVIWGYLF